MAGLFVGELRGGECAQLVVNEREQVGDSRAGVHYGAVTSAAAATEPRPAWPAPRAISRPRRACPTPRKAPPAGPGPRSRGLSRWAEPSPRAGSSLRSRTVVTARLRRTSSDSAERHPAGTWCRTSASRPVDRVREVLGNRVAAPLLP